MVLFIFGLLLVCLILFCITNKIRIKWKTFFKKGFKPARGIFGVYCYSGKQGKGKTFSLVEYMHDNADKSVFFCNIANINCCNYFFYTGFTELLKLKKIIDFEFNNDYDKLYLFCISNK